MEQRALRDSLMSMVSGGMKVETLPVCVWIRRMNYSEAASDFVNRARDGAAAGKSRSLTRKHLELIKRTNLLTRPFGAVRSLCVQEARRSR